MGKTAMSPDSSAPPPEPNFGAAGDVYESLGWLLAELTASPGFDPLLRQLDAIVSLTMSEPSASIILHCLDDGSRLYSKSGGASADADTSVSLIANDASALFLGDLNPIRALRTGALTIRGQGAERFLKLTPLIRSAFAPLYAQRLRDIGRDDLLGARWDTPYSATVETEGAGSYAEPDDERGKAS